MLRLQDIDCRRRIAQYNRPATALTAVRGAVRLRPLWEPVHRSDSGEGDSALENLQLWIQRIPSDFHGHQHASDGRFPNNGYYFGSCQERDNSNADYHCLHSLQRPQNQKEVLRDRDELLPEQANTKGNTRIMCD